MSGPTPGPWKRGRDGNPRVYGPDGTAYAGLLATVYAPGGDGGTQGANARLIAAAPELLAALRNLVSLARIAGPSLHQYAAAVAVADAALAKATGGDR